MRWEQWKAHPDDRRFIHGIISKAPHEFWRHLRQFYNRKIIESGRQVANLEMLSLGDLFKSVNFRLASDDQDIRDKAKGEAIKCSRVILTLQNPDTALLRLKDYAISLGIDPPSAKTVNGVLSRFKDEKWWRRKLRVLHGRTVERIARKLNIVNKFKDIYISEAGIRRRRSQRNRNRTILEELEAINELGESFTLQELAEKSVSNPRLRRAELMTRIAGNEQIANELGNVGDFYTLTCPSRMHSCHSKSGKPNPKYDGTTPKDAQVYLARVWSHIRAALDYRNIPFYGIRVTEPHHDGTPHWHFLAFMPAEYRDEVREIFRQHALKTDGDEKGAKEHRFKVISIDKNVGTATGYIAKYISKNIDGHGLEADLYGREAKSSAERIEAYASTWGLRQFQFFGNPPVTVWRELRRIRQSNKEILNKAAKAADDGDWAAFIQIMGGPCAKKDVMPILVMRTWSDKLGNYDEPIGYQIIGVEIVGDYEISRVHVWEIRFLNDCGENAPPWSTVNNCRQAIHQAKKSQLMRRMDTTT